MIIRVLLPKGDLSKPQNGWNKGLAIINLAFIPGIFSVFMCLGKSKTSGCVVPLSIGYSLYVLFAFIIIFNTKILIKPHRHAVRFVYLFYSCSNVLLKCLCMIDLSSHWLLWCIISTRHHHF